MGGREAVSLKKKTPQRWWGKRRPHKGGGGKEGPTKMVGGRRGGKGGKGGVPLKKEDPTKMVGEKILGGSSMVIPTLYHLCTNSVPSLFFFL